jgi:hypothetical protein
MNLVLFLAVNRYNFLNNTDYHVTKIEVDRVGYEIKTELKKFMYLQMSQDSENYFYFIPMI